MLILKLGIPTSLCKLLLERVVYDHLSIWELFVQNFSQHRLVLKHKASRVLGMNSCLTCISCIETLAGISASYSGCCLNSAQAKVIVILLGAFGFELTEAIRESHVQIVNSEAKTFRMKHNLDDSLKVRNKHSQSAEMLVKVTR